MLYFIVLMAIALMAKSRLKLWKAFLILVALNFVYIFAIIDFLMASSFRHYLIFTEDHLEAGRVWVFLISSAVSLVLCAVIYQVYRFFK
jgi:hypothetical protein